MNPIEETKAAIRDFLTKIQASFREAAEKRRSYTPKKIADFRKVTDLYLTGMADMEKQVLGNDWPGLRAELEKLKSELEKPKDHLN